jgi:hypothetical protein
LNALMHRRSPRRLGPGSSSQPRRVELRRATSSGGGPASAPTVEARAPLAPATAGGLGMVSPELALIDPDLRRHLIAVEPNGPPDRLARLGIPYPAGGHSPPPAATTVESAPTRRVNFLLAVAVLGAVLAVAYVLDTVVWSSRSGPGAAVTRPATPRPATPRPATPRPAHGSVGSPAPKPGRVRPKPTPKPSVQVRRFVWVPAPGVGAYEVALYKGGKPVFRARTTQASIAIAVSPGASGPRTVRPGVYNWYVWALVRGRREPAALVRARVVLTST